MDFDASISWQLQDFKYANNIKRPRAILDIVIPTWTWASFREFVEFKPIFGAVATWMRLDEKGQMRRIIATNDSTGFWGRSAMNDADSGLPGASKKNRPGCHRSSSIHACGVAQLH